MKKKINSFFIIILFICFILNNSYAYIAGTVYLKSDKEIIEIDEEVEITVNLENEKTSAFNFTLYFDNTKLDYISDIENINVIDNRIIFVWFDKTGGSMPKQGELLKLKFKAKEKGNVTFNIEGEFYNEQGILINTSFKESNIKIKSNQNIFSNLLKMNEKEEMNSNVSNAKLESLRLNVSGIMPTFNKDVYEYYLTVLDNINEIEVIADPENSNSTVQIEGNNNLKEGLNIITIKVISEDNKEKNAYHIYVTKTQNLELANNNLETLAIENTLLNPAFDSFETNYKAEISNKLDKINIFAIPQNENSKVKISGADTIKEGNNLVNILVTAPNRF